ncbi:MAG: NUDIX domain-containing protein [Alphaproteobacteria bacterium]|nr:MAG: NUDIX domain-containing protein [Alphaproteobacteria bacterium]
MTQSDRIEIEETTTLADSWGVLKQSRLRFRRSDGSWQTQVRETYDRGHGAVVLLYNRDKGTVILTRQFRFPAYANGDDCFLIEACAGKLDGNEPEAAVRREAEEETGFTVGAVEKLWQCYMSPGSVTEVLHFFVAPYTADMRTSEGGGHASEGEDIEVLELPLTEAMAMVARGDIRDAKTVMLLQHATISGLCGPVAPTPAPNM